jgi:glutaredoxin
MESRHPPHEGAPGPAGDEARYSRRVPDAIHARVLSRPGCHLCDKAGDLLTILSREIPLDYEVVDIDGDPALRDRYDQRVPVILVGDEAICEGRVTLTGLRSALLEVARR